MSAEDALRHSYFRSLGDQVQTLADSEYKRCRGSSIRFAKRCLTIPLSSSAASIFSVKGIQLQKDPGKRSSMYPESGKFSKEGKYVGGIERIAFSLPSPATLCLSVCCVAVWSHYPAVSKYGLFKTSVEYSLLHKHNTVMLHTKLCISLTLFVITRLGAASATFSTSHNYPSLLSLLLSLFCFKYSPFL